MSKIPCPRLSVSRAARTAAVVLTFATACSSQATLLVYEGFNGYTAGALAGQTPNANTTGLNQTVGYYDGPLLRTANYTLQTTGLTLGSLQTSGGALKFTAGTNVIGADLNIGSAYTGTLWSSYLVNLTATTTSSGNGAVIRIGDTPADSTTSHFSSWADSRASTASKNTAVGYGAGATTVESSNELLTNTTYIIINRFTRVGQSISSTAGVATSWALNAGQFVTFLAVTTDREAWLDDVGSSFTAKAIHSTTNGGPYAFSSNESIGIVTVGDAGVYDELRFASSLADVTLIPEPATTALMAGIASGVLLAMRRRRQQARRGLSQS